MRPGALVHLITIEHDVDTDDGQGGQTRAPADLYVDEPAAITPITATERARAGVQSAEATHRIGLWYRPDVTPAMRVIYADPHAGRTRRFEIVTVRNVAERGVELVLETIERVT
jgi:SPP1 family predicted phage head-tail adaptor